MCPSPSRIQEQREWALLSYRKWKVIAEKTVDTRWNLLPVNGRNSCNIERMICRKLLTAGFVVLTFVSTVQAQTANFIVQAVTAQHGIVAFDTKSGAVSFCPFTAANGVVTTSCVFASTALPVTSTPSIFGGGDQGVLIVYPTGVLYSCLLTNINNQYGITCAKSNIGLK